MELLPDRWSPPTAGDAAGVPAEPPSPHDCMVLGRHVGGVAPVACDDERVTGASVFQVGRVSRRPGNQATAGCQPAVPKAASRAAEGNGIQWTHTQEPGSRPGAEGVRGDPGVVAPPPFCV